MRQIIYGQPGNRQSLIFKMAFRNNFECHFFISNLNALKSSFYVLNKADMKSFFYAVISIFQINIFTEYIFAGRDVKGIDMDYYANFAAYGFLAILLLFFYIFFHYSSHRFIEPPKVSPQLPVYIVTGSISRVISPVINIIYYAVIILIVLYTLTFLLLLF